MARVLVLVPYPFGEKGVANRRAQLDSCSIGPGIEFFYEPVKAGPAGYESYHDTAIMELALFEAGLRAEQDGYDAVCIDSTSDAGVSALRSVLDVPVIGGGKASYLMALLLGTSFSVLNTWRPWNRLCRLSLVQWGLSDKCASIRSIDIQPDPENLLRGQEDLVLPRLVEEGLRCIDDGADVICLGSTTMHEAHPHLIENLPVPVINPGPLTYTLVEALLGLGLSHSRVAYPRPNVPKPEMVKAMLAAAAASERDAESA